MSHLLHNVRRTAEDINVHMHTPTQPCMEAESHDTIYKDIFIHFIGANGIPKMDVVGTADPYFVAKLDDGLSFVFVASRFALSLLLV